MTAASNTGMSSDTASSVAEVTSQFSPRGVGMGVVDRADRLCSAPERRAIPFEGSPTPTESPKVPYFTAVWESMEPPPETGAVSPEGLGSQVSQPLASPMAVSPEGAGVLPLQVASNTEVPPQRDIYAEVEQPYQPLPRPATNAFLHVRPGPHAHMRNLEWARKLVKSTFGVNVKYRRRDNWEYWMLIYVGPKDKLHLAAELGEDALVNPEFYDDPEPDEDASIEEQRELASVRRW